MDTRLLTGTMRAPFWLPVQFFLILLLTLFSCLVQADEVPTPEDMAELIPEETERSRSYDSFFPGLSGVAGEALRRYTEASILSDLQRRLDRTQETGQVEDFLSPSEQEQFQKNRAVLQDLEQSFFEKWYRRVPLDIITGIQKGITAMSSPLPLGDKFEASMQQLRDQLQDSPLYSSWNAFLPQEFWSKDGPQTWGELLVLFSEDPDFRSAWVQQHPSSLAFLKQLSEIWAWEDSSIRSVQVFNENTPTEYWVVYRKERPKVPNRFEIALKQDLPRLIRLEYATTVFFNRVVRVTSEDEQTTYHLEAIEKGRSMEITDQVNEFGTKKRVFFGGELMRDRKADELIQKNHVSTGQMSLFLGMRTWQLNQVQELKKHYPHLLLALGPFGFSVTGGKSQLVSNRTDTLETKRLKLTAALIDIIEFAQLQEVKPWFDRNVNLTLRSMATGIGSGGSTATAEPTNTPQNSPDNKKASAPLRCQQVFL